MRKITKLSMLFLLTFMSFSCGEQETTPPGPSSTDTPITINPDINTNPIVYADQTSVAEGVKFTTSEAWDSRITQITKSTSSEESSNWITLNPSSGNAGGNHTVKVTLKENLTGKPRKAKIEFICGTSSIEMTIEQIEVTESGENLDENKIVLLSPNEVMILQVGGKDTVKFECKAEWKASVDTRASEWLTISPENGTPNDGSIAITAIANNTNDQRNGSITLTSGNNSETITVIQKQKDALIVSSSKIELPNSESHFGIDVNANIDFGVEVKSSWIRRIQSKGMTTTSLSFIAETNMTEESRQGLIVINSGTLKDTINVYQAQQNIFVLSKTEHFISDIGGEIEVDIKSNVPYELTMPAEEWVKESSTRAVSSHTRYFTVAPNTEPASRKAILTFSATDGSGLSKQVTIDQSQKDALIVSADTIYTDSESSIIEIKVNTNIDFNVAINSDWIKQIPKTRNLETHVLNFSVGANFGKSRRTAKINFSNGIINQSVVVSQAPDGIEMPEVKEGEIEILTAGTLSQIISKPLLGTYTKLKVKGYMNSADVDQFKADDKFAPSQIKELDLSEVTFTDNTIDGIMYQKQLHTVKLPETLRILGDDAFNDCIALVNIDFGKNPQLQQLLAGHRSGFIYGGDWAFGAFSGCKSLKSFTLPASVSNIEAGIFTGCEALESFNFAPNCKIESLSALAYSVADGVLSKNSVQGFFEKCNSLKTITIPSSVKAIGANTFKGSSLVHIEIPSTVAAINTLGLFSGCKNLVSVKLPRVVTSVGERMFSDCESLKTFTFEGGINSIGDYGFYNCKLIEDYEVGELDSIGEYAFSGTGFKSFTVPNTMKVLPNGLFEKCQQLSSVQLNQLVEIGVSCFAGCIALKSITIPSTVTKINRGAFGSCESLDEFKLTSGDIYLDEIFKEISTPEKITKLTELIIPSGITSIYGEYAGIGGQIDKITFEAGSQCRIFDDICSNLKITSITIPESVVELGGFANCEKLTEIKGMQGVTILKERAFYKCTNLTSIDLPSSLKIIDNGVFSGTSISTLIIPEGVETFGDLSYYGPSPEKLTKIVLPSTLKNLGKLYAPLLYDVIINGSDLQIKSTNGDGIFENTPMVKKIVISKNVKSLSGPIYSENITSVVFEEGSVCQSISGCFRYAKLNELKLPNSIKEIGDFTFVDADIKNFILPTELTTIGHRAFMNAKMTDIDINSRYLKSIGSEAFLNCQNLKRLYINGNDLEISLDAFNNAVNLNSITFGKDLQSINKNLISQVGIVPTINEVVFEEGSQIKTLGNGLFANINNLNIVNLPQSIESLGNHIFYNTRLTMTTITFSNVKEIGRYAFSGTKGVTKLIFPKVITVRQGAFRGCQDITQLEFSVVEKIEANAIDDCGLLTRLELPATLKFIEGFSLKLTPLTELIIHSTTPPGYLITKFSSTENCSLKVPKGSIDNYKASRNWGDFKLIEEIK